MDKRINITMKQLYIYMIFIFGMLSCNSNNNLSQPDKSQEVIDLSKEPTVEEILAGNPAIKMGELLTKEVKQSIRCTGIIDIPPGEHISIHSRTEGFVEQIRYIPGDYVNKGALLFTISNPSLIEKQRRLLETKVELDMAEKDLNRKKALMEQNATSQKNFDLALGERDLFRATYLGLKSELQMLGINITSLEEEQRFQSTIQIYAPQSGHIHDVPINKGQRIGPEDKLMSLANDDHMHLELGVLPKDVSLLAINQKVTFTLPDGQKTYTAEITKINPMIDEVNGTLNVHCHIDREPNDMIKAGLFANAEIEVGSRIVTGLPMEAIVKEGEDYFIYVREGDLLHKHLLEHPVVVMNDFVQIAPLGQEVVVAGAYYVQ